MLLSDIQHIGSTFPLPVTSTGDNATIVTNISAEAEQFIVASTGANDAGSAAGTVIYGVLGFSGVQDSSKTRIGNKLDTSFSWVTGTALTTMVEFPIKEWEGLFNLGFFSGVGDRATKMAKLAQKFLPNNGDFCLDHRTGLFIGRKATTGTSDTANYSYRTVPFTASFSGAVTAKLQDGAGNPITSTSSALDVNIKSANANLFFTNFGANSTLNVKATAGKVFSVYCNNKNLADRYLQLHNTATVPAGAAVPFATFKIPGSAVFAFGEDFFGKGGVTFSLGIAFAFSTTEATYTAATAADQTTMITYL